jgi:hypothetical protein
MLGCNRRHCGHGNGAAQNYRSHRRRGDLAARGAGAAAPKITGHTIPQGELLMAPEPFVLRIPDAAITDLKSRLSGTRFPDSAPGEPWAYGSSVDYIRDLVAYWKDDFDWRAQEAALNEFSQFKVPLHEIN